MANKIQLKRGKGAPAAGVLDVGEPGFDLTNKKLYIGTGIAESPILINKDFPSDYATQTFVTNKIAEAQLAGGTVTDAHINSLIDAKLGVIENGSY